MRARRIELAVVLGIALAGACRKSPAPEPAVSMPAAEAPAAAAGGAPPAEGASVPANSAAQDRVPLPSLPIITVRVGTGLSAEDGVASGESVFKPGEDVVAAVDVSMLPAGAVVKASWFEGSGGSRGEEQKTVSAGMRWLAFTAPGSHNWPEGSYRVDASANTGGVASAGFQIVAPNPDETANQPG